ncbi:MAG: hypothetical protein ABIO64_12800 [Burkholderiaceae bacterium]
MPSHQIQAHAALHASNALLAFLAAFNPINPGNMKSDNGLVIWSARTQPTTVFRMALLADSRMLH